MRYKIRWIRCVGCEYEVLKEEEVTGATVKRSLGEYGAGFERTPNEFGGGTPFSNDGVVAANVSV